MNAKTGIPISVVGDRPAPPAAGLGGGLRAVMYEILALLEKLAAEGKTGRIDVRSLPMIPGEYEALKRALGKGEVDVDLHLNSGLSRCRETAFPGVWWIDHRDAAGATVAEFIEVARVPDILVPETPEIREGIGRLEQELRRGAGNRGVA